MPPSPQSLADIKTSLQNISSGISSLSPTEKAQFEKSGSSNTLKTGLTSLSGTLTSEQARRTVANAQKDASKTNTSTGTGMNDAYSKLFTENTKNKADLAKAQADLTSAQSGLSIADQQKKAVEDEAAAALLKGKKGTPTDPNAPPAADSLEVLAGNDPVNKALLDSANEQRNAITSQLDVLKKQTLDADTDTQFMVRQIENMANQQIQRQEKSNEAVVRGAKVAGLSAGLAQYSPETHSGIVQETINEGLALIQDIEFKAMEKKYEAKKDLRDFKYKSYLDNQKLVTQYNDLKNQTIIKMYEQLQKEETRARETIKFDNDQADRNALIIAPELVDSTPEMIAQTAAANGIEVGALMRAVNDAKFEKDSRALDIESKKESITTSKYNRYLAGIKSLNDSKKDEEKDLKSMDEKSVERFKTSYGWTPPYGMNEEAALAINKKYKDEPASVKEARAKEIITDTYSEASKSATEDVVSLASSDEGVASTLKSIGAQFGVGVTIGGKTFMSDTKKVTSDPKFKEYMTQVLTTEKQLGKELTTREKIELVAAAIEDDRIKEENRKKKLQSDINTMQAPFGTSQSTQAVRIK